MPAGLAAGPVQAEDPAVRAGKNIGADRARDRRLGAEPVLRRLVEEGQRADDDRLELGRLAVVRHVDALAGLFVLLGSATEGEALHVDERARDLQPMTATRMHADATVLMLDTNAGSRIGRLLALVPEAVADGGDRLRDREQTLQFIRLD